MSETFGNSSSSQNNEETKAQASVETMSVEATSGETTAAEATAEIPAADTTAEIPAAATAEIPAAASAGTAATTAQIPAADATAEMPETETKEMPTLEGVAKSRTYTEHNFVADAPVTPQHAAASKGSFGKTFLVAFGGALVACVLAFGVAGVTMGIFDKDTGTTTVVESSNGTQTVINTSEDASLAEAVSAKCLPSVAAITVYANSSSSSLSQYFGYDMGSNSSSDDLTEYSSGSGVVLSADGYVITNYHVVEGGSAYKVTIAGETYDAELVGSDASSDIAVLKCKDASNLTVMEIADSDNLTVGEWVMSIGSPFGLEQSVATGIVSATSRSQIMDSSTTNGTTETTIYPNMIQTDAAINPGNSGGALVDKEGKLIGINTLITSYSGNYSGVGFAIPSNYAINIAQQIIEGKTPTHAQLGVSLSTVSDTNAERYGFSVDSGAYVASVTEGSGAAEAGIQVGDIITAFDGEEVSSASDLMLDVRSKNPGDKVSVTFNRDGEEKTVEVTLGDDSATQAAQSSSSSQSQSDQQDQNSRGYGMEDMFGNQR